MGPLVHLIELQVGRWGSGEGTEFTVSLAVCAPSIYAICWGRPARAVREEYGQVRLRLGALLPGGVLALHGPRGKQVDQWWTLTPATDLESLAGEVATALQDAGAPFLDRFDALSALRDFLLGRGDGQPVDPWWRINAAIVQAQLGEPSSARVLLQEAFDELVSRHATTSPHIADAWRRRIEGVAARLGLELWRRPLASVDGRLP